MKKWNYLRSRLQSAPVRWGLLLVATAICVPAWTRDAPPDSDRALLQASQEWPLRGGGLGQTQYSELSQINKETIHRLGAAWISPRFTGGAVSRATPVVHDGRMFVSAGSSVFAFDARTGAKIWEFQAKEDHLPGDSDTGPVVTGGEGVVVGDGLVFVGMTDGHVHGLDEKTGKIVWTRDLTDYMHRQRQAVKAAPVYANGVLFWSLTNTERYIGRAMALDAKDGHELWHFDVIPAPGEPGHETWPAASNSWKNGGGNIWLPPAVDPELGLVYYGTGNADLVRGGKLRSGNNLYTSCVVALDIKTGKMRWYYQLVHHDMWEFDIATPIVLYDLEIGGRMRKGLAAMRADGYLFLFDRETGKPLVPIEERPVPQDKVSKTAPTQPFPATESVLPDCATYWKDKIPQYFALGCSFTAASLDVLNRLIPNTSVIVEPISFDPQTGYFYLHGRNSLSSNRRPENPYYQDQNSTLLSSRAPGVTKWGTYILAAMDARTGKMVWKKDFPMSQGWGTAGSGGWLTTAGGLAFHRMPDGKLAAFDAKTGDVAWQFQTDVGSGDPSPMSYEIDGKQYIAVIEGSAVWAFALDGKVPPAASAPQPPPYDDVLGPIKDTSRIRTASLIPDFWADRWRMDEYTFDPYRARVVAGTGVVFLNNGDKSHTITAVDNSWTTGPMGPNDEVLVKFDKPGRYLYHRKEHPWSYGEIIVVAKPE